MNNVFTGQSYLTYKLDTEMDLSTAAAPKILYENPDKVKGEWVATIDGTKLVKEFTDTDVLIPGNWKLQSYVEIAGKKAYGNIVVENFKQNLKP